MKLKSAAALARALRDVSQRDKPEEPEEPEEPSFQLRAERSVTSGDVSTFADVLLNFHFLSAKNS